MFTLDDADINAMRLTPGKRIEMESQSMSPAQSPIDGLKVK